MAEKTDNSSESDDHDLVEAEVAHQQARAFAEALVGEEFEAVFRLFADETQAEIIDQIEAFTPLVNPEAKPIVREYWRAMVSLYGSFETIGEIETELHDGDAAVTVHLEFDRRTVALEGPVDSAGKFTELPVSHYDPPAYVDESGITERDLTVETEDPSLGATLTLPADSVAVPGVVLVHGAGAVDRDYTSGANKILKDLAWGLAGRGVGSLRYDKRSYVEDIPKVDLDFDTVVTGDAVSALRTLSDIDEVDAESIFVVGHSLGGTYAPYIAAQSEDIAGIVNLDGNCIGKDSEVVVEGLKDHLEHRSQKPDNAESQITKMEETAERIQSGEAEPEETFRGMPAAWIQQNEEYTEDWLSKTRSLSVPSLIAKTGRYAPKISAERLETLRTELSEEPVQIKFYQDQNHYLQKGGLVPGSIFEGSKFRKPPAETAIADITDFIFELAESND